MFSLNEKVVYPGHGIAQVNRIVEKNIGGCQMKFYELTIISTGMTILVPIDSMDATGIRSVSSTEHIEDMFKLLEGASPKKINEQVAANWSKKNKAYQCAIRTGALDEVFRIYRELSVIASAKELSFGEKNLLHKTENLLVEEICVATKITEEQARNRLRSTTKKAISNYFVSAC